MLRLLFILMPSLLIACSKDKPAPVASAGKAVATVDAPAEPTNLRVEAITDTSARVLWNAVEGATDYDVNYRTAVGGRWTNEPHKGTRLYNTIYDLEPNTEYRWAVRAENGDGASAWIHGPNFTTRPSEEDGLDDVSASPTNLRFDAPTDSSCTVRWDAVEGATDYDVNYKPAVGGQWTNEPHRGIGLYNTIHDLEPNTEYRWAVRAENGDGASAWIHGPNFTTLDTEEPESEPAITAGDSKVLTKLYLVSPLGVYQANPDGSQVKTLPIGTDASERISDLSFDTGQGKMYWADEHKDAIRSANLDGSQVQEILTREDGLRRPECLAVGAGKIFWSRYLVKDGELEWGLYRANIDGSHIETIVSGEIVTDIALDVRAGKVYWVSYYSDQPNAIYRANLDGSDVELLVSYGVGTSSRAPSGFAIDTQHGYMYWSHSRNPGMYRANMDGVVETVLLWEYTPWWKDTLSWNESHGNLRGPRGLAVDSTAGKMYWLAASEIGTVLVRNNLDGSHVETFTIDGLNRVKRDWIQRIVPLFE